MKKFIFIVLTMFFCVSSYASGLNSLDPAGLSWLIKSYKGKTMVVFWAPWCPHCMRELRMLRDNPAFIKKNGLQIVGITKENDASFAVSTIKDEKFPFKFFAGTQDLYRELMRIDAVPYTRVYGHDGHLIDEEYGAQRLEDLQLMMQ